MQQALQQQRLQQHRLQQCRLEQPRLQQQQLLRFFLEWQQLQGEEETSHLLFIS